MPTSMKGEVKMQSIQGYFDGVAVKPLEKLIAKPNQRVIITVMDEFVNLSKTDAKNNLRGVLSQYADPGLAEQEKGAWEHAAVEKHDNT